MCSAKTPRNLSDPRTCMGPGIDEYFASVMCVSSTLRDVELKSNECIQTVNNFLENLGLFLAYTFAYIQCMPALVVPSDPRHRVWRCYVDLFTSCII